jgi:hypothetical protein
MDAKEITQSIGRGIEAAFKTSKEFRGLEIVENNTDIKPEYISTVKIGENLTGAYRIVELETKMGKIKRDILGNTFFNQPKKSVKFGSPWEQMEKLRKKLLDYDLGKKGGKKIDVAVRKNEESPPFLLVEIKLSSCSIKKLKEDIDRLVMVLSMYFDAGLFSSKNIYGVLAFHFMKEESDESNLSDDACKRFTELNDYLTEKAEAYPWLNYNLGLIKDFSSSEDTTIFEEMDSDGKCHLELDKLGYNFSPAMVLLGNASDIKDAPLEN